MPGPSDGPHVQDVRAAPVARSEPIVTPEAVPLGLEVATLGSRGIAYVVDLLIWASGLLVIAVSQALLGGAGFVPGAFGIALLLLAAFALQFGYPIGFETLWRGRTPGKATMGLRVVTVEGAPVGLRHASLRATVGLLELLGTLGLVAVVSSFVSRRGQRLGDLAAGTIVVREPRASRSITAARFDPPPGLEAYVARLDVSGLGAADYATVRETLRRLPSLPATARERVAGQVATSLVARVTPPPPADIPAETWLWCVAAAVQARGRAATPAQPADPNSGSPATPPDDGHRAHRQPPPPDPPSEPGPSSTGFTPPA